MSQYAIKIANVSKLYNLYEKPIDRMKEALSYNKKKYHKEFYALRDISFDVKKGETIGIVGKNGSGKSTLLKIITGVLHPTSGSVEVNGRVSALLELGAGFNFEYTGIENIYLNGTIMNFSKEEMDKKLPEIIDFADIGDFINQPVKNYSSGMFARLAFSVAISIEPEILIVDEALSVGDIFFQNKCYKKFEELQNKGVTILFVSHEISAIKKYCNRVLWISSGKQVDFGDKDDVCIRYYNEEINNRNKKTEETQLLEDSIAYGKANLNDNERKSFPKFIYNNEVGGTKEAEILAFQIKDSLGQETTFLESGLTYTIHIVGSFQKDFKNVLFGITLETLNGTMVYSANNFISKFVLPEVKNGKVYESVFSLKLPKLLRGRYLISPAIASGTQESHVILSWYQNAAEIFIENDGYNLALIELENDWEIKELDPSKVDFK
ncbi:ABC transporter ATP-binding protein [Paenibacillus tyrfis]|uniref:ABC transporter ATP-binding protein n=1 Tax=Paenibacillus tyrfis TaxID=1501230 RepID=UPI00209D3C12|nr:ABC transporter ATP-binding protein [Paenibacillus tyrfis]MCP1309709.1 ABC transporter ATP-binding protein [Paenibacillus tyrfis]